MDELRAVTAFALASATEALPLFEAQRPHDSRPREALEAAASFVGGDPRSRAQRVTALAAHRAGKESASPVPFHAAMAAGDAAASAFERFADFATPLLIDVLYRYPRIGPGKYRISQLVHELDTHLRDQSPTPLTQHDREAERR